MCYKSGINIKEARKNLADALKDWKPPGTKPEDTIRIYYHTVYCFMMKSNTKEGQEAAKKVVVSEALKKNYSGQQRSVVSCG